MGWFVGVASISSVRLPEIDGGDPKEEEPLLGLARLGVP
jgi:hypothetical protein